MSDDTREKQLEALLVRLSSAIREFRHGLDEFERQSLYSNPEWSGGIREIDAALDDVERLIPGASSRFHEISFKKRQPPCGNNCPNWWSGCFGSGASVRAQLREHGECERLIEKAKCTHQFRRLSAELDKERRTADVVLSDIYLATWRVTGPGVRRIRSVIRTVLGGKRYRELQTQQQRWNRRRV